MLQFINEIFFSLFFKKNAALLLIAAATAIFPTQTLPSPSSQGISINGRDFPDIKTYRAGGRILAPLDQIAGALNLGVKWDGETAVLANDNDNVNVTFTAGSKDAWCGGKVFCLDVPPRVIEGRLYLPVRFLCETLGARVAYRQGKIEVVYPLSRSDDIVLNFAGDTTLAWAFADSVKDDFAYPFAGAPWFGMADVTMVNLENPVTVRGYKVPKEFNFRMPPKYVGVLQNGGVDVVNLANNHVWDYGPVGVRDTLDYLDDAGILHVGAGETEDEARQPAVIEVKGRRIGFLGYYGRDGHMEEDVSALKQKVDLVVVNFHWGVERSFYPEPWQIELAHSAVDAGADLVVGHHPHVLQGMERYKGGIIAYSLGNFIFGGNACRRHETVVLQVIVRDNQIIPAIIPVVVSDWQPGWLTGEEGGLVVESVKERSRGFPEALL